MPAPEMEEQFIKIGIAPKIRKGGAPGPQPGEATIEVDEKKETVGVLKDILDFIRAKS